MAKRGFGDSGNDEITHADVNPHLTSLSLKEGVKVVAKATPLSSIWADVRQPRRAIPASIRLHWNGSPDEVPDLLNQWGNVARLHIDIDERSIIRGSGEGIDLDGVPAIVESYVSLLRLASDIKHVGLTNPITVVKQGNRHLIESGERRYLAHHLLVMWDDAQKWDKVPAIISDGKDFVWRQATENTARRSLNAIGMARQLALLIMDAREGIDGVKYDSFEDMVLPGGCDRRFYSQVAKGNIHRIPKGMGERIQAAMGLSDKQLSRYRNLLQLTDNAVVNDALWMRADIEDWAEGVLRDISTSPIGEVSRVINRDEWSLDDLRALISEAKEEKQATSALPDEGRKFVEVRGDGSSKRLLPHEARLKVASDTWQARHEDRQYQNDDDLTQDDEREAERYDNHYHAYLPNWAHGTRVIFDEACAVWVNMGGAFFPRNDKRIDAGREGVVTQLFTQRTNRSMHSLARVRVDGREVVVPVQALAMIEASPTQTASADDHIAALTGDEVKRGMASDNVDSVTSPPTPLHSGEGGMLAGGDMIFVDTEYGNKELIKTLFNLMSLLVDKGIDPDDETLDEHIANYARATMEAREAVRDLHNVTLATIERWHAEGEMNARFNTLYEQIAKGLDMVLTDHIGVMMANVEELVKGFDDA